MPRSPRVSSAANGCLGQQRLPRPALSLRRPATYRRCADRCAWSCHSSARRGASDPWRRPTRASLSRKTTVRKVRRRDDGIQNMADGPRQKRLLHRGRTIPCSSGPTHRAADFRIRERNRSIAAIPNGGQSTSGWWRETCHPRLPIKVPRAEVEMSSPKGVTRFCNGIDLLRAQAPAQKPRRPLRR